MRTASTTSSSWPLPASRSQAQVANDARVMAFAKARVVQLEQDLRSAQNELNTLKARLALATQREDYVLGEVELIIGNSNVSMNLALFMSFCLLFC